MDVARDKKTLDIVSSDELLLIPKIDTQGYICIGCSVKATPCSYTKENKKRPYFRFDENIVHGDECFLVKTNENSGKNRTDSIEGFPLSYPNKLILQNDTDIVGKNAEPNTEGKTAHTSSSRQLSSSVHSYSVKTILPIVNVFIRASKEIREQLQLSIPAVDGTSYSEVIWSLAGDIKPMINKMRYSKIYLPKPFYREGSTLTVNLLNGHWENGKPQKLYKLIFNIETWTMTQIEYVTRQIEDSISEHSNNNQLQIYAFFIGMQSNRERLEEIFIHKYNDFCCVASEPFS